jgi:phosphate ABC transporter permease subunit PstA
MSEAYNSDLVTEEVGSVNRAITVVIGLSLLSFLLACTVLLKYVSLETPLSALVPTTVGDGALSGATVFDLFGLILFADGLAVALFGIASRANVIDTDPNESAGIVPGTVFGFLAFCTGGLIASQTFGFSTPGVLWYGIVGFLVGAVLWFVLTTAMFKLGGSRTRQDEWTARRYETAIVGGVGSVTLVVALFVFGPVVDNSLLDAAVLAVPVALASGVVTGAIARGGRMALAPDTPGDWARAVALGGGVVGFFAGVGFGLFRGTGIVGWSAPAVALALAVAALTIVPREDVGSTLPAGLLSAFLGLVLLTRFLGPQWQWQPENLGGGFVAPVVVPSLVVVGSLLTVWAGSKASSDFGASGRQHGAYLLISMTAYGMIGVLALLLLFVFSKGWGSVANGFDPSTLSVPFVTVAPELPGLSGVGSPLLVTTLIAALGGVVGVGVARSTGAKVTGETGTGTRTWSKSPHAGSAAALTGFFAFCAGGLLGTMLLGLEAPAPLWYGTVGALLTGTAALLLVVVPLKVAARFRGPDFERQYGPVALWAAVGATALGFLVGVAGIGAPPADRAYVVLFGLLGLGVVAAFRYRQVSPTVASVLPFVLLVTVVLIDGLGEGWQLVINGIQAEIALPVVGLTLPETVPGVVLLAFGAGAVATAVREDELGARLVGGAVVGTFGLLSVLLPVVGMPGVAIPGAVPAGLLAVVGALVFLRDLLDRRGDVRTGAAGVALVVGVVFLARYFLGEFTGGVGDGLATPRVGPFVVAVVPLFLGWVAGRTTAGTGFGERHDATRILTTSLVAGVAAAATLVVAFEVAGMGFTPFDPGWLTWPFVTNGSSLRNINGVAPAIVGTVWLIAGAVLFAVPLGIGGAIFLTEYAEQGRFTSLVGIATNALWSTPSIVYGLFGFAFLMPRLGGDESLLGGMLVLGFMLLPLVLITTRESIKAVPDEYRDGSAALGVNKWQTIRSVVLPAALPGAITGVILGVGRIAGETAPLILILGGTQGAGSPVDVIEGFRFTATPPFVANEVMMEQASALPLRLWAVIKAGVGGSTEFGWGTAMVLLMVVLSFYVIGIATRKYFRRKLDYE